MPLVKQTLKVAILEAFKSVSDVSLSTAQGQDIMADKLAEAIDKFVKSGTVITSGSPTSQTGQMI